MWERIDPPADFARLIHQALRSWHTGQSETLFADLLLAQQLRASQVTESPSLVSNQILLAGLESMQQTDGEGAELLQRRFLDQEAALEVAHRWNLTEDIIYQRQRAAIGRLAEIIWAQEIGLRQTRFERIAARLESPTYSRLFGATDKMAEVRTQLEAQTVPWLIAIEGQGGIGKTALADALTREFARRTDFHDVAWLSARRRLFRLWGEIGAASRCGYPVEAGAGQINLGVHG